MVKRKGLIISGSILIAISFLLLFYFGLISTGVIATNKIEISINTESRTFNYDGEPHKYEHLQITNGKLRKDHYIDPTFHNQITNVGEMENSASIIIRDDNNVNVTDQYEIELGFGTISVEKRQITLTSESLYKDYDGQPLTNNTVKLTNGNLAKNDRIVLTKSTSAINSGRYENLFNVEIRNNNENVVTDNYNIIYDYGELTINPINLLITTGSSKKDYDGTPLFNNNYEISSGALLKGHKIEYSNHSNITDPGKIDNIGEVKITDENGENVTDNYNIRYNYGELEVLNLTLYFKFSDSVFVYDGESKRNPEVILTSGFLQDGHSYKVLSSTERTTPGEYSNKGTIIIVDQENKNVTNQYKIEIEEGTLTINKRNIEVISKSATKVYDGQPLIKDEAELLDGNKLLDGHYFTPSNFSELTEVGSIDNKFIITIYDIYNENISDYYNVKYHYGTINVLSSIYSGGNITTNSMLFNSMSEERLFSVRTDETNVILLRDKSFGDYNGLGFNTPSVYFRDLSMTNPLSYISKSLTNDEYTIQLNMERRFVEFLMPYFATTHIDQFNDFNVNGIYSDSYEHNYKSYNYINDGKINLNTNLREEESVYSKFVDSTYLKVPLELKYSLLSFIGNDLNPSSDTLIIDIMEYVLNSAEFELDINDIDDEAEDVVLHFLKYMDQGNSSHFASLATMIYRAFGIPARYTTGYRVEAISGELTYVTNKDAHSWTEVYITGMGWVPIEVTFEDNREVLELWPIDKEKEYDGTELVADSVGGFDELYNKGYRLENTFSGSQIKLGESSSTIEDVIIYDENGNDVTKRFNIVLKPGKLEVYRNVRLDTFDLKEEYSGYEIKETNHENYSLENLIDGHDYEIEFTGSRVTVGTTSNTAQIRFYDENGKDVTEFYKVQRNFGNITVTPRNITIKTKSFNKKYDGTELRYEEYEIIGGLANGDKVSIIEFTGTQTNIGYSENSIGKIVIVDKIGNDVTNSYIIKQEYGELRVTP